LLNAALLNGLRPVERCAVEGGTRISRITRILVFPQIYADEKRRFPLIQVAGFRFQVTSLPPATCNLPPKTPHIFLIS